MKKPIIKQSLTITGSKARFKMLDEMIGDVLLEFGSSGSYNAADIKFLKNLQESAKTLSK